MFVFVNIGACVCMHVWNMYLCSIGTRERGLSFRVFLILKFYLFPILLLLIYVKFPYLSSVQFSSVTQSCLILCDPMDCNTPGLTVHHQFLELAQTHVHWVSDAIQPSHPLSSPSPPAFNLPQHQGLFQWVSSSHQVAKVLGVSALASVFPSIIQGWFLLGLTDRISLQSKGLSSISSNTTVQKYRFFCTQLSL